MRERLRTTDKNSKPDIIGIVRSEIIRSGSAFRITSKASKPLAAVITSWLGLTTWQLKSPAAENHRLRIKCGSGSRLVGRHESDYSPLYAATPTLRQGQFMVHVDTAKLGT